jgi:hypothetical protein
MALTLKLPRLYKRNDAMRRQRCRTVNTEAFSVQCLATVPNTTG